MKRSTRHLLAAALVWAVTWITPHVTRAGEIKLLFPLQRTLYQTNEAVRIAVIRTGKEAIPAGTLNVALTADFGGKATFAFPVNSVALIDGSASATVHLQFNAQLLRPGKYTVEIACDGASATSMFDLHSHVRQSTFKLVDWGSPDPNAQRVIGEDGMGYNLVYGPAGLQKRGGNQLIAGGVDQMACCTMSGGHQMDLRMECDWSDPLVAQGGTRRTTRRALADRTDPNILGVHFYDEPGLTWEKDPETNDVNPHAVTPQHRSYEAAFGKPPLRYNKVDPKNPDHVAAWTHWATWKLGFMDAAWKDAQFGVSSVNDRFLSLTQSQYGFSAFTDGYYFNVVRSLPMISGHGGYDDWGPGYFNPSLTLEISRARDHARDNWYLPLWYGATESNRARAEQYLSFITHLEGLITPPEMEPGGRPALRQPLVESNQLMKRLGTIFNAAPVTPQPVTVLYSLSTLIRHQTGDMKANYAHAMPHGATQMGVMLAGYLNQQHLQTIVEEDILDGTLAANHKAVVLTAVTHLESAVIKQLEDFAAAGGLVLTTSDTTVKINGATALNAAILNDEEGYKKAQAEFKDVAAKDPANKDAIAAAKAKVDAFTSLGAHLKNAEPVARAMRPLLEKAGIQPIFTTDEKEIAAGRQVCGEVEYVFMVNAKFDQKLNRINTLSPDGLTAKVAIPTGGRPIYDAILGGAPAELKAAEKSASGALRFGPGQLRAFAVTARPIGGVRAGAPTLHRDYTLSTDPFRLRFSAAVNDKSGGLISGAIPLEFLIIDPLGDMRYTLYRATQNGVCDVTLPLAVNDAPGEWKVVVKELLSNTSDTATFNLSKVSQCGALAGLAPRAVFFPGDDDRVFRFARNHQDVTLVVGTNPFDAPAADRVKKIIEPWGIRAKIVNAADVNKARSLTEDQARTFVGLDYAPRGGIKPGDGNPPQLVGFAVDGPVILIGHPGEIAGKGKENPLLDFIATAQFLPFNPVRDEFPGRGCGMVAWQRDAIGRNQESVALIAFDEAGMAEAVGTFYEMVAGLRALTPASLPSANTLTPASIASGNFRPARVLSTAQLPDRIVGFKVDGDAVSVLAHDGTLANYKTSGEVKIEKTITAAEAAALTKDYATPAPEKPAIAAIKEPVPNRLVKFIAGKPDALTAIAYWGGTLQVIGADGKTVVRQQLPQDASAIAWVGAKLIVGLANGQVLALEIPR